MFRRDEVIKPSWVYGPEVTQEPSDEGTASMIHIRSFAVSATVKGCVVAVGTATIAGSDPSKLMRPKMLSATIDAPVTSVEPVYTA
jgi:hypothetical protein